MISFLKTVLIILLVYLGLKYLLKWLAPYVMRYIAKKATERMENAFGQHPFGTPEPPSAEEVRGKRTSRNPKSNGKVVGEYIEFEELD